MDRNAKSFFMNLETLCDANLYHSILILINSLS